VQYGLEVSCREWNGEGAGTENGTGSNT